MVKRWRPDVTYVTGECFAGMIRDSQGEYVEHDDFAALEAENARLKEALRECVEIVEANQYDAIPGRFTAVCKGCGTKCGTKHANFCSYERALTKAREVLGDA